MTAFQLAKAISYFLYDDIAEGGPNKLKLTNIHHSDYAPNVVSIETMKGQHFTITINKGYVG